MFSFQGKKVLARKKPQLIVLLSFRKAGFAFHGSGDVSRQI